MKRIILAVTLAAAGALAACTRQRASLPETPTPNTVLPATAAAALPADSAEAAEVRQVVEDFGARMQMVSLLGPDAAAEMQAQYADLVAPALLETWTGDVLAAPGRLVSSPWPDRIEIASITAESPTRFVVTGHIIEVTSLEEAVNDKGEIKIPVRMVVEKQEGRWLIIEYAEER